MLTKSVLLIVLVAIICTSASEPEKRTNCWTCGAGFQHWYDAGLSSSPGGDPCGCVPITTTSTPGVTHPTDCWTCSPGYVHWWEAGRSSAPYGDRCACVRGSSPTTTTKAPSTTTTKSPSTTTTAAPQSHPTDCWTCSPGYVHWWEAGKSSAPNGDRCACVASSSPTTTTTPSTTTTRPPSTTTTKAPAGTPTDCWTCSPGYVHWWEAGRSSAPNGDRCACVASSSPTTTTAPSTTTTKAPTTTTTAAPNCWTCSPGYVHWYEAGMSSAPNGDKCACVAGGFGSTPTTTSAPWSGGGSGSSAGPYAKYTGRMRTLLDAMTIGPSDTGSISFSAAVAPYSPWNPPPTSLITDLLNILKSQTKYKTLQMYYIDQWTVPLIAQAGFRMLGIISLVASADNSAMINAAIAMAKAYPDTIVGLACGNELGNTNGITWSTVYTVSQCVTALKSAGVVQPVGVVDTYDSWCGRGGSCATWSDMASLNIDFIGANIYPFWDNVYSGGDSCNYANTAGAMTMSHHKNLVNIYNVPVIVTEWGWPGAPEGQTFLNQANYVTGQQCGVCNNANQKVMVQSTIDLYRNSGLPLNTFEAFREAWKSDSTIHPETNWGICLGTYPYTCVSAPN